MGRFLTEMPPVRLLDPSEWRGNRPTWELEGGFAYEVCAAKNGHPAWVVHIPRGHRTDFASIPWLFQRLIPPIGKLHAKSSLVHDYLCDEREYPRPIADVVFLCALEDEGLWWVKRYPLYFGVRFWGMLTRQG